MKHFFKQRISDSTDGPAGTSRILKKLALWTVAHVGLLFVWLGLLFKYQQRSLETSELLIWSAATVFVWTRLVLLYLSWRAASKEPMLDR